MAEHLKYLTDAEIAQHGMEAVPDVLIGTPEENKRRFDELVREPVRTVLHAAVDKVNEMVDAEEARAAREADFAVWEPWSEFKHYVPGNKVTHMGASYLCIEEVWAIQSMPMSEGGDVPEGPIYQDFNWPRKNPGQWLLIADRGEKGDTGDRGEKGDKGDTGPTGPVGPRGEPGAPSDMTAAVYDPSGYKRDIFKYVQDQLRPVSTLVNTIRDTFAQRTGVVTDWRTLISAAHAANLTGDETALNSAEGVYTTMNFARDLVMDMDGTPVPDFATFKSKLRGAVLLAGGLEDTLKALSNGWDAVQYYFIFGTYPTDNGWATEERVNSAIAFSRANFWWYNGGTELSASSTLAELIKAAVDAGFGRSAGLNTLDLSELYGNNAFQFRKNIRGDQYAGADFQDFLDAVTALTATPGHVNPTWEQIQYYLIHGTAVPAATASAEATYYWWRYGRTGGTPVAFTGSLTGVDDMLGRMLQAAWRETVNGDPNAWNYLNESRIEYTRLIRDLGGQTDFADALKIRTADFPAFKAAMGDLVTMLLSGNTDPVPAVPTVASATWYQIQHYLLTYFDTGVGEWKGDAEIQASTNYWWRTWSSDPATLPPPDEAFQTLLDMFYDMATGGPTTNGQIDAYLTVDMLNLIGFQEPWCGEGAITPDNHGNIVGQGLWDYLVDPDELYYTMTDAYLGNGSAGFLTFAQVQLAMRDWCFYDPATAESLMPECGFSYPAWVLEKWPELGEPPEEIPGPIEPFAEPVEL